MPDDRPTAPELLDAVVEFLESELQPALEGRLGFHTRVAVNALKIVRREMELGPALDDARRAGLQTLLGTGATVRNTREGEAELARRIRAGALDAPHADLMAYLRATLRLQLAIVHPGYERQEAPGA